MPDYMLDDGQPIADTAPTFDGLLDLLKKPIRLCAANYSGAPGAYLADRRTIVRDREEARMLIRWAQAWGVDAQAVADSSSRLNWSANAGWDYIPGQYYQTEVCASIASAVADGIVKEHQNRMLSAGPIAVTTGAPVTHPFSTLWRDIRSYIAACNPREGRRLARWFK